MINVISANINILRFRFTEARYQAGAAGSRLSIYSSEGDRLQAAPPARPPRRAPRSPGSPPPAASRQYGCSQRYPDKPLSS